MEEVNALALPPCPDLKVTWSRESGLNFLGEPAHLQPSRGLQQPQSHGQPTGDDPPGWRPQEKISPAPLPTPSSIQIRCAVSCGCPRG